MFAAETTRVRECVNPQLAKVRLVMISVEWVRARDSDAPQERRFCLYVTIVKRTQEVRESFPLTLYMSFLGDEVDGSN